MARRKFKVCRQDFGSWLFLAFSSKICVVFVEQSDRGSGASNAGHLD